MSITNKKGLILMPESKSTIASSASCGSHAILFEVQWQKMESVHIDTEVKTSITANAIAHLAGFLHSPLSILVLR